jgi:hypothetical protein
MSESRGPEKSQNKIVGARSKCLPGPLQSLYGPDYESKKQLPSKQLSMGSF